MDDADLVTCLDLVQQQYLLADPDVGARTVPSLADNRDALRLFNSIGDADLRDAVLSLLRVLNWPADGRPCAAPSAPPRPAASRPT